MPLHPDDDGHPLIDAVTAAWALGVKVGTIRQWAFRGKLRRRGRDERGATLYRLEDLDRLKRRRAGLPEDDFEP